jgi:hypothetical protein
MGVMKRSSYGIIHLADRVWNGRRNEDRSPLNEEITGRAADVKGEKEVLSP